MRRGRLLIIHGNPDLYDCRLLNLLNRNPYSLRDSNLDVLAEGRPLFGSHGSLFLANRRILWWECLIAAFLVFSSLPYLLDSIALIQGKSGNICGRLSPACVWRRPSATLNLLIHILKCNLQLVILSHLLVLGVRWTWSTFTIRVTAVLIYLARICLNAKLSQHPLVSLSISCVIHYLQHSFPYVLKIPQREMLPS